MRRALLITILSFIPFISFGQGHTLFSDEDPAFDFIKAYLPEYYFEDNLVGRSNSLEFSVRTLYNYIDDRTFSYYVLTSDQQWGCLDIDEIDSIIAYLERTSDKTSFPSKTATAVYNTRRGFKLEATPYSLGAHIKLHFPKNGPICETNNPSSWIKALKNGKDYVKYDSQFVLWGDSPDEGHGYYAAKAVARVRMRYVVGSLPKPKAIVNEKGKIVVQIVVDQYGNVTSAGPGAEGTTIMDEKQWDAARSAAMKTHFSSSASAPSSQTGSITYSFEEIEEN